MHHSQHVFIGDWKSQVGRLIGERRINLFAHVPDNIHELWPTRLLKTWYQVISKKLILPSAVAPALWGFICVDQSSTLNKQSQADNFWRILLSTNIYKLNISKDMQRPRFALIFCPRGVYATASLDQTDSRFSRKPDMHSLTMKLRNSLQSVSIYDLGVPENTHKLSNPTVYLSSLSSECPSWNCRLHPFSGYTSHKEVSWNRRTLQSFISRWYFPLGGTAMTMETSIFSEKPIWRPPPLFTCRIFGASMLPPSHSGRSCHVYGAVAFGSVLHLAMTAMAHI